MLGKIACLVGGIAIGYLARDVISDLVETVADAWNSPGADAAPAIARNDDPENVEA